MPFNNRCVVFDAAHLGLPNKENYMKKQSMIGLIGGLLAVAPQLHATESSGTVYVGGQATRLTIADLPRDPKGNHIAIIDVEGDIGEDLIFDIDVKTAGKGSNQFRRKCRPRFDPRINPRPEPFHGPRPDFLPLSRAASSIADAAIEIARRPIDFDERYWNCKVYPTGKFSFEIEVSVTCNGIPIAYEKRNKNEMTTVGKLVTPRDREMNFLLDSTKRTDGKCRQLKVEINPAQPTLVGFPPIGPMPSNRPLERTVLSTLNLDVHVLERF